MNRASMLAVVVLLTGCGDALAPAGDVVARVERYDLPGDRLAELMAGSKRMPLRPETARAVAALWVDYTIFTDRLVRGDSLVDSLRVVAAMWPGIQQELADRYHAQLVANQVRLDARQVDSAYAAGDLRLIQHVLVRVEPTAATAVRAAARRRAEHLAAGLRENRLGWSEAVQTSDDAASRAGDGSVGVIARGEQVVPFEVAAFALAPGELTGVVQTSYGYHILRRPHLADVREEFVEGVEQRLEEAFDASFLAEGPARWDIRVRANVVPAVREAARDPLRAKASGALLGTYRGGRLRMSDLARWIQAAPGDAWQQVDKASDAQITELVASVMQERALVQEALDSGVQITAESHQAMANELRRQLSAVGELLGLTADTLEQLRSMADGERGEAVTARILAYLASVAGNRKPMQAVPPFLADALRDEVRWAIFPPGVDRVVTQARRMRVEADTAGS